MPEKCKQNVQANVLFSLTLQSLDPDALFDFFKDACDCSATVVRFIWSVVSK